MCNKQQMYGEKMMCAEVSCCCCCCSTDMSAAAPNAWLLLNLTWKAIVVHFGTVEGR